MIDADLMRALLAFRKERNWEQFHTPKNLAIAIAVEAGELLEQFQWTEERLPADLLVDQRDRIASEIADVAILLTYLAHDLDIDIDEAVSAKLAQNAGRYPIEKSWGKAVKYDQL